MKRDPAPTLSRHLLNEANKYLIYPDKLPRGVRPDDDRFGIDEMFSAVVEGRLTFVAKQGQLPDDPEKQQRVLDTTFCRDLLKKVPEMVQRARDLDELALPKSVSPEALVYLRESAKCLISGLPQATVALARAALEACLLEGYAKVPGNTAEALRETKITLGPLISKLSALYKFTKGTAGVSPEMKRQACVVKDAGDDVLHGRPIKTEKALEVYEAARSVILSVTGG